MLVVPLVLFFLLFGVLEELKTGSKWMVWPATGVKFFYNVGPGVDKTVLALINFLDENFQDKFMLFT